MYRMPSDDSLQGPLLAELTANTARPDAGIRANLGATPRYWP